MNPFSICTFVLMLFASFFLHFLFYFSFAVVHHTTNCCTYKYLLYIPRKFGHCLHTIFLSLSFAYGFLPVVVETLQKSINHNYIHKFQFRLGRIATKVPLAIGSCICCISSQGKKINFYNF